MSDPNFYGLTRSPWQGTWSPGASGTFPTVINREIRGTLQYVSGAAGDRLTNITGQRVEYGMLAFLQTGYTAGGTIRTAGAYYQYTSADPRNVNTGELPNTEANWAPFNSGSSQWEDTSNGIYYNQPGNTVIVGKSNTDSSNAYSMDISGTLYTDNLIAQSYETFSDVRLKCNISTFNMTNRVLSLGTFAYNYISNSTVTEIGLLAQEVERVAPEIVREQCGYKTIQYDRIPILLLPVIKQQQQQILYLEEQIRVLKAAVGIR